MEKEKGGLEPLVKKKGEQEKKIQQIQEKILKKLAGKEKKLEVSKRTSKKLKKIFDNKMRVINLIDRVNKDKDNLEKGLIELIKKAKSFQLTSKELHRSRGMTSHIWKVRSKRKARECPTNNVRAN